MSWKKSRSLSFCCWKSRCIIGRQVLVSGPHNGASHLGSPIWAFCRGLNLFGIWLVAPPRNGRRLEEGGKEERRSQEAKKTQKLAIFCATAWEIGYSHQAIELLVSEAKRKRFFRAKSWSERPNCAPCRPLCWFWVRQPAPFCVLLFTSVSSLSLSLARSF